jgi:multidrug efflux pump subunit AcrB
MDRASVPSILTILSTLPSAGIGALLAPQLGHMNLSVSLPEIKK